MLEKKGRKQHQISDREQRVAVDIIMRFYMLLDNSYELKTDDAQGTYIDKDNIIDELNDIYLAYNLCDDPFTKLPCTNKEYAKNSLEKYKQIMMERYGHHDGLYDGS